MRAFELKGFGVDSLKLVKRPQPRPGPREVLVRMKAASLNYRDLMTVLGEYNPKLTMPRIPFSDGVGEVIGIGDQVTRVQPGERVASAFFRHWVDGVLTPEKAISALGDRIDGVLAEQVLLHEDGVVHVPACLSDEEAATLPCAALTAWHALTAGPGLKPGDTVLIQGTGGVSIFALQFARLAGARVIATSSSDEKLDRVRTLGASDGINYRHVPDWDRRVIELTAGQGVDHIIEVGGAGTLAKSLQAVRIGGRISLIGVLTGKTGEINPLPILFKNACVQGIFVGSRVMFEAMNRAIEVSGLRPVIDRAFGFEQAPDALRYMQSGAHFGKIVLRFD